MPTMSDAIISEAMEEVEVRVIGLNILLVITGVLACPQLAPPTLLLSSLALLYLRWALTGPALNDFVEPRFLLRELLKASVSIASGEPGAAGFSDSVLLALVLLGDLGETDVLLDDPA